MNKLIIPLFFVAFGLSGCKSLSKLTQFDMDFTQSVTIPSEIPLNFPFDISTPDVATNSTSYFSSNSINPELIDKIELKNLELTVTAPANGNFNFLKSVEIFIKADGLDETQIAWLTDVPVNAPIPLQLLVSGTDLKEFIMKDKFSLRVKTTTDELITSNYTVAVKTIFMIDVKVLGL